RPKRPRRLPDPVLLRVTHQLEPQLESTPFHLPPEHASISGRVHEPSPAGPRPRPTPSSSSARSREPASLSSPSTLRQLPHKPPPPPPHQPSSPLLLKQLLPHHPEPLPTRPPPPHPPPPPLRGVRMRPGSFAAPPLA